MPTEVVYSGQPGSLPFTIEYTPKSNRPVVIHMQGTVFGSGGPGSNGGIGLECWVDGKYIGNSPIWSNAPQVHRTTFPMSAKYEFDLFEEGKRDSVKIKIDAMSSGTVFDHNDLLSILIFE